MSAGSDDNDAFVQEAKSELRGGELRGKRAVYNLEKVIGGGSFGVVFLASIVRFRGQGEKFKKNKAFFAKRGLEERSKVAVKRERILRKRAGKLPNEVYILEKLSKLEDQDRLCDEITCMYDRRVDDNYSYLIIEYVPYSLDLAILVGILANFPRNQANIEIRMNLLIYLISAVGYIHLQGIYHMDIKPENVIVGEKKHLENKEIIDLFLERGADIEKRITFEGEKSNLERFVTIVVNFPEIDEDIQLQVAREILEYAKVKLIDFGFAKLAGDNNLVVGGTPNFLDPWLFAYIGDITESRLFPVFERELGDFFDDERKEEYQNQIDEIWEKADIWSLGATIYTVYYGRFLIEPYEKELGIDYTLTPQYFQHRHVFGDLMPKVDEKLLKMSTMIPNSVYASPFFKKLILPPDPEDPNERVARQGLMRVTPLSLTEEEKDEIRNMTERMYEVSQENGDYYKKSFENILEGSEPTEAEIQEQDDLVAILSAMLQLDPRKRLKLFS